MGDSPIDREGCLALGGLRCFEVGALHSTLLVAIVLCWWRILVRRADAVYEVGALPIS